MLDNDIPRSEARLGDRSLFPKLEDRAYLNHSGISAPALPVLHAVQAFVLDYMRLGALAFTQWQDQRNRLRAKLATLIGAAADDIAFVQSTTRGLSDISLCIPWRPKDRVILFQGEFPANVTPWQRAAPLFDLEIVFVPLGGFEGDSASGLSRLEDELRRGARLVAVSAVQFQTGLRMPLKAMAELCHKYGAEICVDGVQACGAVPIDVTHAEIDYLSCGSHKWLMGLEGSGFIYIRESRVSALHPTTAGWLSHEEGLRFLFEGPGHLRYDRPIRQRADFVEGGNYTSTGLAALGASLDLILQIGVPAIFEHVNKYLDSLEAGLLERGFRSLRSPRPERRSCILGVHPPASASLLPLHRSLVAAGVACSIPDGVLRFGPHWPNNIDEVPYVLATVDAALQGREVG